MVSTRSATSSASTAQDLLREEEFGLDLLGHGLGLGLHGLEWSRRYIGGVVRELEPFGPGRGSQSRRSTRVNETGRSSLARCR